LYVLIKRRFGLLFKPLSNLFKYIIILFQSRS